MKKTHPTLFARTSTGAVQIWFMEQDGDKYRSTSGQENGLKIVAEWTEAVGKNTGKANETTAREQATAEIEAKYKKQLKSGGYHESINDIDKERFFQVMLAKSYGDYKETIDWKKGVAVQIKYNGARVVARQEGLFTRKGEPYVSIPHIQEGLEPFFKKFPNAILDGEGFNFDRRERLNEILSLMRRSSNVSSQALANSKDLIRYYIYDGFGFGADRTDGYLKRKAAIDNAFFARCFAPRYVNLIEKVPTWVIHSEAELNAIYKAILSQKHEGAILRILDAPYEEKRSKFLLKYKPLDDDEFRVVSVQEGDGKFADRVATFTCEKLDGSAFLDGNKTFNATFKGEEEEAAKCWKNKLDYVGKVVTIYYNGVTAFGKPNYPRFDYANWRKS